MKEGTRKATSYSVFCLAVALAASNGKAHAQGVGKILQVPMIGQASRLLPGGDGSEASNDRLRGPGSFPPARTPATSAARPSTGSTDLVLTGRLLPGMKIEAMAMYDGPQLLPQTAEIYLLFTPWLGNRLGISGMRRIDATLDEARGTYRLVIPRSGPSLRPQSLDEVHLTFYVPDHGYFMRFLVARTKDKPRNDALDLSAVARFEFDPKVERDFVVVQRGGQRRLSTQGSTFRFDGGRPGSHTLDFARDPAANP